MIIFLKLAWRNIFRNKRRTFLAASAIGIGLGALIFTDALLIGWKELMISTATSTYLGEAQIHHDDFRRTFEAGKTIPNHHLIIEDLKNCPMIKSWTRRTQSFAMISSAANVHSISVSGIEPKREKDISKIDEAIKDGKYLQTDTDSSILIGYKLAEILEVELGDKIVLTAAQADTGDMSQEMFRIGGIFDFGIREMDRNMAFIGLKKSQKLLGLNEHINEIALTFANQDLLSPIQFPLWLNLQNRENIAAESWLELLPELSAVLEMLDFSMLIMAIILFIIVTADIVNTLFMSLYERMFEFGILRAVGTRPVNMALLIVLEAGCLAIISSVIGIIIGFFFPVYFQEHGIDYSGTEFVSIAMEAVYPVLRFKPYIIYPVIITIFTMLIGLYPGIVASQMTISKTLKEQF